MTYPQLNYWSSTLTHLYFHLLVSNPILLRLHPPKRSISPDLGCSPPFRGTQGVWAFTKQVTQTISQTRWHNPSHVNLTAGQKSDLLDLQRNPNIVIKPSDKGGNLVVMDVSNYESMVLAILNNAKWYRKVSSSHLKLTISLYQKLIGSAYYKEVITKPTWEYLNVSSPRTPTLYALPKIHKDVHHPPGHPIVWATVASLSRRAL